MGQRDTSFDRTAETLELSYETRELAWELGQPRIDSCRIRFLMETGADLAAALHEANLSPQVLAKNPQLKPLQLQRHLSAAPA